jgi:hypothetical protein
MPWTSISNAAVAVGGIPSSTVVTALRDNPGAMAAGENGAPVVFAGWHPYNKVSIGDGETGLIYNSAVDGTQASVVTPDFEDGYEYRILAVRMSHNHGSAQSLRIEFADGGGSYTGTFLTTGTMVASERFSFDAQVMMPRVESNDINVLWLAFNSTVAGRQIPLFPANVLLRARVTFSAGSIDSGKIYFLRRREYVSSP